MWELVIIWASGEKEVVDTTADREQLRVAETMKWHSAHRFLGGA